MISPPRLAVTALWVLWLVSWTLAAGLSNKTVVRQSIGARLAHMGFIWAGAILWSQSPRIPVLDRPVVPYLTGLAWAGVLLTALGFVITGWARVHLGRLWSSVVTLKSGHTLVRTGPYAITRHPIYSGLLLALLGSALVFDSVGVTAACALMIIGGSLKIHQEESLLTEHFGDAYRDYQREVPTIIPRLAARR